MAYFKYTLSLTSREVERSFSVYKNIGAPNRKSFKFEKMKIR